MNSALAFLARLLIASLFLVAGARKVLTFQGVAQMMAAKGFPSPEILLVLTIALELGGGLMLIFNWQAHIAAFALAAFTIVAGSIFHDFWSYLGGDAGQFSNQLNHFLKNLAIVGGLLHVAAARRVESVTSSIDA
ncbi:MAG: DoxX family protein [Hyphomicrobiaceae bacterium]